MSHQCALNKMGGKKQKKNASKSVRVYLILGCLCCPGQQRALEMGSVWKESKVDEAFTIGLAPNLCGLSYVYHVMLGYFVALGVNWDFVVARDLVFGVLAGFSPDFVNFHSFSNIEFWLRFSFISRFINFRSLFLRAGPLLMCSSFRTHHFFAVSVEMMRNFLSRVAPKRQN